MYLFNSPWANQFLSFPVKTRRTLLVRVVAVLLLRGINKCWMINCVLADGRTVAQFYRFTLNYAPSLGQGRGWLGGRGKKTHLFSAEIINPAEKPCSFVYPTLTSDSHTLRRQIRKHEWSIFWTADTIHYGLGHCTADWSSLAAAVESWCFGRSF